VTYDSGGAHFTVAKSGDAPTLTSVFYIMFGKVSVTMKAAPGAGIVSTLVLQSDDLDEIDMEWLGADGTEVQTNYFGKGDVTTYNRGAFNPAANNQNQFITYTVEWTATQVTWSVGGNIVRVLTPATADTNQYPQTPMQVKFGAWSGGDSSNAPGTIAWARGPTNYANGPFTMTVQSIAVTDYSTGTQYKYGDTSGNWGSIQAVGGKINGNSGGAASSVASADVPAVTSASPSIPAGVGSTHGSTSTLTGWPWVATTLSTVTGTSTSVAGVPSGWIITSSGKIVPASSAAVRKLGLLSFIYMQDLTNISQTLPAPTSSYSVGQSPSPSLQPSGAGLETITGWDDRGFPTTKIVASGANTGPKSYDQQGFLITTSPTATATAIGAATQAPCFGSNCGLNGKIIGSSSANAAAPKETFAWRSGAMLGIAAAIAERLLL
jgi:Glycosyl hydrolases family 16